MRAELVYKSDSANAALLLYDEYASDELRAAICCAGWLEREFSAPRLAVVPVGFNTESFYQPSGSGLFGRNTELEGNVNIVRLREALAPFGIVLSEPRRLLLCEQL
jgi:hypothetical protein